MDAGPPKVRRRFTAGTVRVKFTLRLTETGAQTGVFTGYVQSSGEAAARAFDTLLNVAPHLEVEAAYTDPDDATDQAVARALVDPGGLVFDSLDGRPVDGVGRAAGRRPRRAGLRHVSRASARGPSMARAGARAALRAGLWQPGGEVARRRRLARRHRAAPGR